MGARQMSRGQEAYWPPLCFRIEHARMHAKHRGHEAMHAEMVLILIATLVVAQLLLVQWKQRHSRSYNVSGRSGCLLSAAGSSLGCRPLCRMGGRGWRVLALGASPPQGGEQSWAASHSACMSCPAV